MDQAKDNGHHQNPEVEPQRPVLDIIEIMLHAGAHLLETVGLAPEPADLRPAGDTGLDAMATEIAVKYACVFSIMGEGVGAWPDQGHLAPNHVEQLWELVEAGAPKRGADGRDARVAAARLDRVGINRRVGA